MPYGDDGEPPAALAPSMGAWTAGVLRQAAAGPVHQRRLLESNLYHVERGRPCNRRVVVGTPGLVFFRVRLEEEEGEGAEVGAQTQENDEARSAASEDDVSDSEAVLAAGKPLRSKVSPLHRKKANRRERLFKRVMRMKGAKERRLRAEVAVRDVHNRNVFVQGSYDSEPTLAAHVEALREAQQEQLSGETSGSHAAARSSESFNLVPTRDVGTACFLLDPADAPAVLDLSFEGNAPLLVHTTISLADRGVLSATGAPFGVGSGDGGGDGSDSVLGRRAGARTGQSSPVSATDSIPTRGKELLNAAFSRQFSWSNLPSTGLSSECQSEGILPSQQHDDAGIAHGATGVLGGAPFQRAHSLDSPMPEPIGSFASMRSAGTIDLDDGEEDEDEDEDEDTSYTSSTPGSRSQTPGVAFRGEKLVADEKLVAGNKLLTEAAHLRARTSTGLESVHSGCGCSGRARLAPLVIKGDSFYEYLGHDQPLGRTVLLRGVNLSGNCKLPVRPDSRSHLRTDWGALKDPKVAAEISFVGRPFPLSEAEEHLGRLSRWGFNCLRFLVTWEAIEHAGPGQYDVEYLDYVQRVVELAGHYGLYVFIDPHQDVWSRMTGGSGAPAWTLTAAGLDLDALEASEAAFTHNNSDNPAKFQRMSWPQNYQRFAAMHMFTLFWGGNDFAPGFSVDGGIPIQEYLQRHFINAMMQVVKRVKDMPHVIGFDSFNEPSPGFIGNRLDEVLQPVIPPGPVFKPFDSMVTAAGIPRTVSKANAIGMLTGRYRANKGGVSAWAPGATDVWRAHGVWEAPRATGTAAVRAEEVSAGPEEGIGAAEPRLLQPDYFCVFPRSPDRKICFFRDFLRPFMVLYISKIRSLMPRAILFAEGDGFGEKEFVWDHSDPLGVVNASHWYDGYTLFTSNFNPRFSVDVNSKLPVLGASRIYNMHLRDLSAIKELPEALDGTKVSMPTLIGEFGLPYNMNGKYAYRTGDFRLHERALGLYYDVMDALRLNSTQWNYCADNSNEWGDNWNLEDLSLFSRDQQERDPRLDLDSGGRAITGFSRPYAPFVSGLPITTRFDRRARTFDCVYQPNARNFETGNAHHATTIFLPDCQYLAASGASIVQFDIIIEGGTFHKRQRPGRHEILVWADSATCTTSSVVHVQVLPVDLRNAARRSAVSRTSTPRASRERLLGESLV